MQVPHRKGLFLSSCIHSPCFVIRFFFFNAPCLFAVAEWRLFSVRGELPEEGSLLEADCCCAGLRSRGSVVLLSSQQGALYLWTGCKAPSSSREVSKRAAERLTQM